MFPVVDSSAAGGTGPKASNQKWRNIIKNRALSQAGRTRAVIERVSPEVDGGRFPIKRTVGEDVIVEADIFVDGHDQLLCLLLHRPAGTQSWVEVLMTPVRKDRWQSRFSVDAVGRHE
ncbi:MAG: DUF3416 domain-containing protein, partial [Proteobacteria bacterium]